MQLVALKYFVAVADHGSFTAAAERLGVSASTLTRSGSTLEDNLGLTLFERSLRGVALAPGAAPVLAETKRMLARREAVTAAAGGAGRGIAGDLRAAGAPLHPIAASKQTVFSLVASGFGVTLAQQSQAEASFPGVTFRKVDETNARVEFSLAWSPQSECAVIGRFLASMRASAADKGVGASASSPAAGILAGPTEDHF